MLGYRFNKLRLTALTHTKHRITQKLLPVPNQHVCL